MKRVLCVFCVLVFFSVGFVAAGDKTDRPASLYDAFGLLNAPTGAFAYAPSYDAFTHATMTPDTTLVRANEGSQDIPAVNFGPPITGLNVFTEFFTPGISPINPGWEFTPEAGDHFFPSNSALLEIHYSNRQFSTFFTDPGESSDGIFFICTVCQDVDLVPGDYEACVPCSSTAAVPNMLADMNQNLAAGNSAMPSYHGYAILDAYTPSVIFIDLATIQGRLARTTAKNLILRYPRCDDPQFCPEGPEGVPVGSDDDTFRRSR